MKQNLELKLQHKLNLTLKTADLELLSNIWNTKQIGMEGLSS
jgi:hypothetical protein